MKLPTIPLPVQLGTGGSITYGGIGFNEASQSHVNQMAASSTHIFRLFGGHTVTYGYQFEDDVYNDIYQYTGAPFTLPNIPALGHCRRSRQSQALRLRGKYETTPNAACIAGTAISLSADRAEVYARQPSQAPSLGPTRAITRAISRTRGRLAVLPSSLASGSSSKA